MRLLRAPSRILAPLLLAGPSFTALLSTSALVNAQPHQATFQLSPQSPPSHFKAEAMSSSSTQNGNGAHGGEPSPLASERVADAQTLFGAKPDQNIFRRSWSPDAIFEDPICYATGYRQYAAQWYAMRLFSKSTTSAWRMTVDTPTEVQYVQKQVYGIDTFGIEKVMDSTVVMKLDDQGRIKHFQDKWDHKGMPGFWAYPLRRLNAYIMPLFISVPSKVHPDYTSSASQQNGGGSRNKKEL